MDPDVAEQLKSVKPSVVAAFYTARKMVSYVGYTAFVVAFILMCWASTQLLPGFPALLLIIVALVGGGALFGVFAKAIGAFHRFTERRLMAHAEKVRRIEGASSKPGSPVAF